MPLLHLLDRPRRARAWRSSWAVTAALALLAGSIAAIVTWRGEHAARSLGDRRLVPVAEVALHPGDAVRPDDLTWQRVPAAAVPASAVVADPVDRVVTAPIVSGEVLVEERLAASGLQGPVALAPAGSRLVAVAPGPAALELAAGDVVDLLAVAAAGGPPTWVARRAVVVEVGAPSGRGDGSTLTVAVGAAEAADVAAAAFTGGVAAVLVPPP